MSYIVKILAVLIVIVFIVFLFSRGRVYPPDELSYGVTFSDIEATALGLNWQETFLAILYDLGAKKLRLPAYWSEIEAVKGGYRWDTLDWELDQAGRRDSEIILAVGGRLPRWPECHFPDWAQTLTRSEREKNLLAYIEATVKRYRDNGHITAWQVENEPFLPHFGECPPLNRGFLDEEIALVKSLDDRPIVVTDSGELSFWVSAAGRADIFGTTMYRDTYSRVLKRYIHYPIAPGFFRFKKNLAALFAHPQKWIVIELQAEPWAPVPFQEVSKEERDRTMNLDKFKEILEFSRQAGFNEFYLWGAEYWYWERVKNGDSGMWDYARTLF